MPSLNLRGRFKASVKVAVTALVLLSFAVSADAQEIREKDTVYVKGQDKPFVGMIVSAPDEFPIIIELPGGVKATVEQAKLDRILPRQDAQQAFDSHSKTLKDGDATAHYKLAQWGVDQELLKPASEELKKALKANKKLKEAYELAIFISNERLEKVAPGEEQELLYNELLRVAGLAIEHDCWSPRVGLAQGQALIVLGFFEPAIPVFKKVIAELRKDGGSLTKVQTYVLKKCWIGLGRAQLAADKNDDAQASMEALALLDEQSFFAYFHRAQAKMRLGKIKEAADDFTKALSIEAAYAEAHAEVALCHTKLGKIDEAILHLKQALAYGLSDTQAARTQLGMLYLRKGKLKSAGHEFIKTRDDRLFGPAEVGLALIKARKGETEAALVALKKAESLIPLDGMTKALRAQLLARLGRNTEAAKAYQEAVRLGFNVKVGLRALADLSVKEGNDRRAAQWLNYLVANDTLKNAGDCYRLARILLKEKKFDRAREIFEQALKLNENHVPSLNGLGYLAYSEKAFADATRYFKTVLNIDASNLYAKRAIKNIGESQSRKVWIDDFKRDGLEVANLWNKSVGNGIVVKLAEKKKVLFNGTQASKDMGKTELYRKMDGRFVRFEASINTKNSRGARVGIRIRIRNGAR
ncbi:MAG: tetratricopeptide repeat protein, partial [Planctomycetota bacterium]|nr:tetratricopeptide repeat protein [Planctomycetota bacterium]